MRRATQGGHGQGFRAPVCAAAPLLWDLRSPQVMGGRVAPAGAHRGLGAAMWGRGGAGMGSPRGDMGPASREVRLTLSSAPGFPLLLPQFPTRELTGLVASAPAKNSILIS